MEDIKKSKKFVGKYEKPAKDQVLQMLRKDELLKQIVRVTKQLYPNIRLYTDKYKEGELLNIFPEKLSHEQCDYIGKLIRSDYSYEIAGDDMDYPFFIDVLTPSSIPNLVDITDLI